MYKDLPVLIIEDWTEITEEFLNKKYEEFKQKKYNNKKAFASYWLKKIKRRQSEWLKTNAFTQQLTIY